MSFLEKGIMQLVITNLISFKLKLWFVEQQETTNLAGRTKVNDTLRLRIERMFRDCEWIITSMVQCVVQYVLYHTPCYLLYLKKENIFILVNFIIDSFSNCSLNSKIMQMLLIKMNELFLSSFWSIQTFTNNQDMKYTLWSTLPRCLIALVCYFLYLAVMSDRSPKISQWNWQSFSFALQFASFN